jgi:glycosyltransferase involved in cell wall biosynthesis
MRVTVVGPTHPYRGGISHYTDNLVRSLTAHEHELSLVSFKRQYPRWMYPGHTDRDPSKLFECLPAHYLLDPLAPSTWGDTVSYITASQPDVVILQWWATFWAPAFAALGYLLNRRHIPLLYIVHDVLPQVSHPGDIQLTRLALRWGAGFITSNTQDRARLTALVRQAPIESCAIPVCHFPSGKPVSRQEARTHLKLPADVPVILFFGFVRPYKGFRYLLQAVARLQDQGQQVMLIVAGECWEDKALYMKLIRSLCLEHLVRWDDRYIPNEEVGAYFTAADMLVAPYLGDSPSAVVSLGMYFGIPSIVTPTVASRLAVQPANMRIVPPADPRALAVAISEHLDVGMSHAVSDGKLDDGWTSMVERIEHIVFDIKNGAHTAARHATPALS